MPRLAKGGKWVFGWSVVGRERTIWIPPDAYEEYDFEIGMEVFFIRGGRTSGGFSVARKEKLLSVGLLLKRIQGSGTLGRYKHLSIPEGIDVKPGDRMLAVKGQQPGIGVPAARADL